MLITVPYKIIHRSTVYDIFSKATGQTGANVIRHLPDLSEPTFAKMFVVTYPRWSSYSYTVISARNTDLASSAAIWNCRKNKSWRTVPGTHVTPTKL